VGRGYFNNTQVTAERFLERDGVRYFRTGDLCREVEGNDGQLEILGRCDFMVKARGYSVVLEAVETAILKRIGCSGCCVVAVGAEGEDKRLAVSSTHSRGIPRILVAGVPGALRAAG
jgi:acyl-CoA synthetase (AMP-forming)/AMP-acid ligase II